MNSIGDFEMVGDGIKRSGGHRGTQVAVECACETGEYNVNLSWLLISAFPLKKLDSGVTNP